MMASTLTPPTCAGTISSPPGVRRAWMSRKPHNIRGLERSIATRSWRKSTAMRTGPKPAMPRMPSRCVMMGLVQMGMRTSVLTIRPTRSRRMSTQGRRCVPVAPSTRSQRPGPATSPRAFTSRVETIEPFAPVSTRKRNGPLPSIITGTTIRSWTIRVRTVDRAPCGCGTGAALVRAVAAAAAGSSSAIKRIVVRAFMQNPRAFTRTPTATIPAADRPMSARKKSPAQGRAFNQPSACSRRY